METAAVAGLPGDVLAAILGRLLARSLAASRCVCKAWRDVIDGRRLLLRVRRHLLPHAVHGIFVNYVDHRWAHFFARPAAVAAPAPASSPLIDGEYFSFIEVEHNYGRYKVADHCNGLVLYLDECNGELYVCNPVTRRWVHLPLLDVPDMYWRRAFLVFNPAVSPHYEVLVSPLDPEEDEEEKKRKKKQQHRDRRHPQPTQNTLEPAEKVEWPPSRWTWHMFSSRTRRWRERVFVREGGAAGLAADMVDYVPYVKEAQWRYGVYWQGALYVHCKGEYVARLYLSNGKYRVIKSAIDRAECFDGARTFIGRSEKGVYFASINALRLRVWVLNECPGRTEWILKHDHVLKPHDWWEVVVAGDYDQIRREGPWILDDYNETRPEKNVDWSSDDDDIIYTVNRKEDENQFRYPGNFHFLGFHPYKEVVFLTTTSVAVAYHLNSSKVQFLGLLKPSGWNCGVYDSFVYTPCYALRDHMLASADLHETGQASSSCS